MYSLEDLKRNLKTKMATRSDLMYKNKRAVLYHDFNLRYPL